MCDVQGNAKQAREHVNLTTGAKLALRMQPEHDRKRQLPPEGRTFLMVPRAPARAVGVIVTGFVKTRMPDGCGTMPTTAASLALTKTVNLSRSETMVEKI